MAKQPHHEDDSTSGPQDPKKPHKNGGEPNHGVPPIPNMSLDDEDPIFADEVEEVEIVEEVIPVEDVPMVTEAIPVTDDDVFEAEIVEDEPVEAVNKAESDVFLADAVEEEPIEATPAEEVIDIESASDIFKGEEAVLTDEVVGAHPMDSPVLRRAPISDEVETADYRPIPMHLRHPDMDVQTEMVSDHAASGDPARSEGRAKLPPTEIAPQADEPITDISGSEIESAEEIFGEPTPASDLYADEVVFDEDIAEAAPASVVDDAEEVIVEADLDAEPASAVRAEEVLFDEEIAEADPVSEVEVAEEVVDEAEPASAVEAAEEVLDDEVFEAAPASAVEEEYVVAEEASSATRKAESVFDEFDEPAANSSRQKGDSGMTTAFEAPLSDAKAPDSLVDEDDLTPISEGSAVNLGDIAPRKGSSISGIDPVAEALESGLGIGGTGGGQTGEKPPSVEFDELLDDLGGSSDIESPIPQHKKDSMADSTEMDAGVFEEAAQAKKSKPSKKKPGGKDKKPVGQTGDDLDLDDIFASEKTPPRHKKDDEIEEAFAAEEIAEDEESAAITDFEAEDEAQLAEAEVEEAIEAEEAAEAEDDDVVHFGGEAAEVVDDDVVSFDDEPVVKSAKSSKKAAASFESEEVAEASEADIEEAVDEEAEATDAEEIEAFAEEEEASSAKTKSKKKGKAGKKASRDDDEEIEADDDEEVTTSKKKNKKGKTITPPAPAQPSMALRWIGGMFVGVLLFLGAAAAGLYFAPYDMVKDYADKAAEQHPQYKKQPPPEKTKLEKARIELENGKFDAVEALLPNAVGPELATRGEARWLAYFKQQNEKKAPLSREDPKVKDALKDLTDSKNDVLKAQVEKALSASELETQLQNSIAAEEKTKKELDVTKADREKAEAVVKDVKQALVDGKVAPKVEDIDTAMLPKTLKDLGVQKGVLDSVNKLLKDGNVESEGDKGVKEVLDAKKKTEDELALATKTQDAVNKLLENEKTKGKNAEGVQEIVDARKAIDEERKRLTIAIAAAFKELVDGKIVPMSDDPAKQIVAGAKAARKKSESPLAMPLTQLGSSMAGVGTGTAKVVERTFDLAWMFSKLGFYTLREPLIQTPEKKMDTYISLLGDRNQKDPKMLAAIQREADWVMGDNNKDVESRAKAFFVRGLAQRNLENFAKAKADFEESLKTVQPITKAGDWTGFAKKSLQELTQAKVYFLPRIEDLERAGQWKAALAETNVALKAMPQDASLFAERALILLELVKGQGAKIAPAEQKAILADADAAAGDGKDAKLTARSAYLQGMLAEELGQLKKAEELYRQALKQARSIQPESQADVGLYLNALGNVLLRDNFEEAPAAPAAPAPAKEEDKKGEKVSASPKVMRERVIVMHPWTPLILSAVVAAEPDEKDDLKNDPKLKEVIALAQELINSTDTKLKGKGYLMLGQAYVKKGERTEGLKVFSKGLHLLYPGLQTTELNKMIDEHPAFQQPDTSNIANPEMAARYFGEGIHYYWTRQYTEAEAQFRLAVKFYDQDARYFYFLGLSQWAQETKQKREQAIFSFEQGARLEARGFPTVDRINLSLERIQGKLRQQLNEFRYKAVVPAPEGT